MKKALLITNLGTPDAPTPEALKKYLGQFLMDKRVIQLWYPFRWLLVHGIILRVRPKKSAKMYDNVWTEEGSPLLTISQSIVRKLQDRLGDQYIVKLGMRYGSPSIESALHHLQKESDDITVLPMFPQFSHTTTSSVYDAVAKVKTKASIRRIQDYHNHPDYIAALANTVKQHWETHDKPELLLMSFHGIPQVYVKRGDVYADHCHETARLLAEALGLQDNEWKITFQSRLGLQKWLMPYTDKVLEKLPKEGITSVHAICPGFSVDCLETIDEIGKENKDVFMNAGGKAFSYIPALNDSDAQIECLVKILENQPS